MARPWDNPTIPRVRMGGYLPKKETTVCPCCLGRVQLAHTLKKTIEDCTLCKGLRIVYRVTTYETIPEEDIEGPLNIHPRGM